MKSKLSLGFSLALLAPVATVHAQVPIDPELPIVATTLTRIRAYPDAFRNVKVEFDVQFASLGKVSNPFFTPFQPAKYANFYAWATEQPIWRQKDYDDVFGLLFLSKTNEQLQEMYATKTFERMRLLGYVRNTFQNQPWIEILSFEHLGEGVETATLSHMFRAERRMSRREWKMALSELSLASQAENPMEVKASLAKSMGLCYLRLGEASEAVDRLQEAVDLMEDKADIKTKHLLATALEDPSIELDRHVDHSLVKDSERPMWEVFEDTPGGGSR